MFNSILVPSKQGKIPPIPKAELPPPKPATPHTITLYQEKEKVVLCVDRANERFTTTHLTPRKLHSISLYVSQLLGRGWHCWPCHNSVGWLLLSPDKFQESEAAEWNTCNGCGCCKVCDDCMHKRWLAEEHTNDLCHYCDKPLKSPCLELFEDSIPLEVTK